MEAAFMSKIGVRCEHPYYEEKFDPNRSYLNYDRTFEIRIAQRFGYNSSVATYLFKITKIYHTY